MAKRAVILLYFVLNFFIDFTNSLSQQNVLFSAQLNTDQELIFDGPDNYMRGEFIDNWIQVSPDNQRQGKLLAQHKICNTSIIFDLLTTLLKSID